MPEHHRDVSLAPVAPEPAVIAGERGLINSRPRQRRHRGPFRSRWAAKRISVGVEVPPRRLSPPRIQGLSRCIFGSLGPLTGAKRERSSRPARWLCYQFQALLCRGRLGRGCRRSRCGLLVTSGCRWTRLQAWVAAASSASLASRVLISPFQLGPGRVRRRCEVHTRTPMAAPRCEQHHHRRHGGDEMERMSCREGGNSAWRNITVVHGVHLEFHWETEVAGWLRCPPG